jgi:hypothetical protein
MNMSHPNGVSNSLGCDSVKSNQLKKFDGENTTIAPAMMESMPTTLILFNPNNS